MKIKGIIQEIIKPEEQKNYFLPNGNIPETKNKFYIRIVSDNAPKGFFKILWFNLKNRNLPIEKYPAWVIVLDSCDFKEGDEVELEVERLLIKSEIFTLKK